MLQFKALTMLDALSATPHLGRSLSRSSLSDKSTSTTCAMFSPLCLSENNEQNGVHLDRKMDCKF